MFFKKQATGLFLAAVLALPAVSAALPAGGVPPSTYVAGSGDPVLTTVDRRVLAPDVAEYSFRVRVGDGPYDFIGVHRVVKEIAPNVPVQAAQAVFLAHGDIWNFRAAFLTGAKTLPVYLAQNGVDVWGIDFRWTSVPANVTNLSFMESWGIEQDARDLGIAIGVARFTRSVTGSGYGQVNLLGWSRGGQIGYAYLNGESQIPARLRQVKGFIPADIYLKTDVAQLKGFACQRQLFAETKIESSVFANDTGVLAARVGGRALTDPNGASTDVPGLNNREAGLLVGEATHALQGGLAPAPFYHMTGGNFDPVTTAPTGLFYANEQDLFTLERSASSFQPFREQADADAATCEQTDVPFDDHLHNITVPILYLGAGGGFGDFGVYTTTLLGSTDVTTHVVSLTPIRAVDFGHADLFLGTNADTLVWQPLLTWLQAH
ncbi:MAG TPA: hypothetical protein VKK31_07730 [Thermoanaerobaculia bacterium]|nr:hypothetical protein [Thermoanaerobaculia bacterium]